MADTSGTIQVLSKHVKEDHGVIDVASAMQELQNPREALKDILGDPTVSEWHFYALEGLRSMAAAGAISRDDGKIILEATKRVAQQRGNDEFYKTFDAIAQSKENAPLLADFADEMVVSRNQRDWAWLAFSAVGTLMQHQPKAITGELRQRLANAVAGQQNAQRRDQMLEIAKMLGANPHIPQT